MTRPWLSSALWKSIPTKTESCDTSIVCVDRHLRRLTERTVPFWRSKSFMRGMSPGFPLANRLALPDSESAPGVSQHPPTCAYTSLSQDGFCRKGLWVVSITYYEVVLPPFLTSKETFCACWLGKSPNFQNEK